MCWIFFGQRFGHACNIGFVDLIRSGALQRAESTMSRGAGMNSISEIHASSPQAVSSSASRHPRDWQESRETTLEHCRLWSIEEIALDAGSIRDRARQRN